MLRLAQCGFGLLAFCHIEADAKHPDSGTILVADDLPDAVQMTDEPVAANDPLFVTEVDPCFQGVGQARLHMGAIIRMDEAQEVGEGTAKLTAREPIDSVKLVRPADAIFRDVPRPASEIGQPLRFGELDVGIGELSIGISKLRIGVGELAVRPAELEIGIRQCRGAVFHALVKLGLDTPKIFLAAATHLDIGAQRQARHRHAEHEGEQEKERFIEAHLRKWAHLGDCRPYGKNSENDRDRRGIARPAAQCCPDQRQNHKKSKRARILGARQ